MNSNTVCRNFDYNEKAGGILDRISLNCSGCEYDNNCDIKTSYENAKKYSLSFEYDVFKAGANAIEDQYTPKHISQEEK